MIVTRYVRLNEALVLAPEATFKVQGLLEPVMYGMIYSEPFPLSIGMTTFPAN